MDINDECLKAYNQWALSRGRTVPENVWRLRTTIIVSMVGAFALEVAARYLRDAPDGSIVTAKVLSLVGLLLLSVSALYLIFLLSWQYVLKVMVTFSVVMLMLAQGISLARDVPVLKNAYPHLAAWGAQVEGPLLLAGLIGLLTTFYLALLEAVSVKAMLRKQQFELYNEIMERERAQSELRDSWENLRQLSAHVEHIRENERSRMFREIHDELGQPLTRLKIDLEGLRLQIPQPTEQAGKCYDIINSMKSQIDSTVQTTRRLMTELHPAIVDDLGLQAAVEWLVLDFKKRTGIDCRLNATVEDARFGAEASTVMFRVLQECLANVVHHAKASEVSIQLHDDDGVIKLEIADNGQGFVPHNGKGKLMFGILGMRERMALLGGELKIDSNVGKGTCVTVAIPDSGGTNGKTGGP